MLPKLNSDARASLRSLMHYLTVSSLSSERVVGHPEVEIGNTANGKALEIGTEKSAFHLLICVGRLLIPAGALSDSQEILTGRIRI